METQAALADLLDIVPRQRHIILTEAARCRIEDVDAGAPQEMDGATVRDDGLSVPFDAARQSALVFIETLD